MQVTCQCGYQCQIPTEKSRQLFLCPHCGANLDAVVEQKKTPPSTGGHSPAPATLGHPSTKHSQSSSESHVHPEGGHATPAPTGSHGPYTIIRPHAQGSMGKISVAHDQNLDREVIIKELSDKAAKDVKAFRRFIEEAKITGRLEHPGIVPVHALGMDAKGHPFYAMKMVMGNTLKEALAEYHQKPTPAGLKELLRRLVMVCQTMAYAHIRGVIHRDLKPSNIMLGAFGETLVLDWGLAKPVTVEESPQSTLGDLGAELGSSRPELTAPGSVIGTPGYMAPEQAEGKIAELSPACDIYSLGAVLYQILTGQMLYKGSTGKEVLHQLLAGPPERPRKVSFDVPRPLEAICLKAMARQPHQRYTSAQDMAQDLQNWLDDEPVRAYRERIHERLLRQARKHTLAVITGSIALIVVLVILGLAANKIAAERARRAQIEEQAKEYARQAGEANQQAKIKDTEARRLGKEVEKAQQEADEARLKANAAARAVEAAQNRIAQLEGVLQGQTEKGERTKQELAAAQEELAALTKQLTAETARAKAAQERVGLLEQQVAALRAEVQVLRRLSEQLTGLAGGRRDDPQALGEAAISPPWEDLTEQSAENFDVSCSDGSPCQLTNDTTKTLAGGRCLHLVNKGIGKIVIAYPKKRNAQWDLSKQTALHLAYSLDEAAAAAVRKNGLQFSLGRGSKFLQLEPKEGAKVLGFGPNAWAELKVPLAGNVNWKMSDPDHVDLSQVEWVEVFLELDRRGGGIRLDDWRFGLNPAKPTPSVEKQPDRQ